MVDFKSLLGAGKPAFEFDLEKIFSALDVKSTHTEPRLAQREAMSELTERKDDRDIVLKVSTGAGKTTVGLLYAYAHMRSSGSPVVYLCPTVQLVGQVLEEAGRLGIQAHPYPRGEPIPHAACSRGEAILVCTYEKLFNAMTTFNRNDVQLSPHAVVLDDAHAGAELVRKQFTLRLHGEAFDALKSVLHARCSAYHSTRWSDICGGDAGALLEVPHWIWSDLSEDVRNSLHAYSADRSFKLVWPYLEGILPYCRCVVAGSHAEISPEINPVEQVRPYAKAPHRLFMSATLADDSLLVRELGVAGEAAKNPICPSSDRGVGERMILAPSLVNPELDRQFVIDLCAKLQRSSRVVVLTSSELSASDWVAAGASHFGGENFQDGVEGLRQGRIQFAVFAQRYDGVDLADDACRVLVLDGIPFGESLADKVDSGLASSPGGVRNRTVFRIEQGMGRAVRSHKDYAVVLLVGPELASYVGRREILSAMTNETRLQLELSVELARLVKEGSGGDDASSLEQVVAQCLSRNDDWKAFYNERIRKADRALVAIDGGRIDLADAERKAYWMAMSQREDEARAIYAQALDASKVVGEERGVLLQRLARIHYRVDQGEGLRVQQAARQESIQLATPPAQGRVPRPVVGGRASERVCLWMRKFANLNGSVIEAERVKDSINFGSKSNRVEAAIQKLGEMLGAESSRPDDELKEGPDNLWMWDGHMLVIEVKSQVKDVLPKSASGQLHDSLQWSKETYPQFAERCVPIVVSNARDVADDAHFPNGTVLLDEDACRRLAELLRGVCSQIAREGPVFATKEHLQELFAEKRLHPNELGGAIGSKL